MTDGRVVMVLQARMGSTRLPGKSLMPLAGRPLVARVLERVVKTSLVDAHVLATTEKPEDDPLAELGAEMGVDVFRGSENDLLDRYYQCAKLHGATHVVRVPADNPVPEPGEIDRVITYHVSSNNDFSSNYPDVFDNGYPDGIGAEVYRFGALETGWQEAVDPRHREHPHTFFYDQPERFSLGTIECPADIRRPDIVLDVNTQEEYAFLTALYDDLYPKNPSFTIHDVIRWYDGTYKQRVST